MPDDHSEVVPLLPIPNRTVKRLCANDSAGSRVKVGHRQALTAKTPSPRIGRFFIYDICSNIPSSVPGSFKGVLVSLISSTKISGEVHAFLLSMIYVFECYCFFKKTL